MAYVTHAQLAQSPGAYELAQVATDEQQRNPVSYDLLAALLGGDDVTGWPNGEVAAANRVLARIDGAAAEADALIDAYLAKRGYELPLSPVPVVIASKARDIVRYLLHKNRLSGDGDDPIVRDYKLALQFLEKVAAGKIGLLQGDDVAVQQTGAHTASPVNEVALIGVCRQSRWAGGWL